VSVEGLWLGLDPVCKLTHVLAVLGWAGWFC
jgi:hypothetical protein